ncbi:hypothetical protein [Archangium sp. Cb G35]|uniref:hypothetical protein n=1 Tax=Archangium sp. Cb G35 TaxID=1920190 RepID=UPI001301889E|nr:hypothetical protein [Archangium sp. Cb G35]
MKERGIRRLPSLHDQRDSGLGDFAREGLYPEQLLELPGDDLRGSPHLRWQWIEKDPPGDPFPTSVIILYAINRIDRRQNADAADNGPAARPKLILRVFRHELRIRIDETAEAGINGGCGIPDIQVGQHRPEFVMEHPPLIDLLELLFPQPLESLQLGAPLQLAIELMVRTPVVPSNRKQVFR